jgi:hypothetical protein
MPIAKSQQPKAFKERFEETGFRESNTKRVVLLIRLVRRRISLVLFVGGLMLGRGDGGETDGCFGGGDLVCLVKLSCEVAYPLRGKGISGIYSTNA